MAEKNILDFLQDNSEVIKGQIKLALPRHLKPERMLRVLTTEIRKIPKLLDCTIPSILGSLIQCSQLGLEPGGVLGQAYLIPYHNKKANKMECQFIIGYKGMLDLAYRSGKISSIRVNAVYTNDEFEYSDGLEIVLRHVPAKMERGDFIGAYAIAKFSNCAVGDSSVVVMYKNEVDKIRDRSKPRDYSPWFTDYEEMAKKTVLRRLFKYLPISIEINNAVILDEAAEKGKQLEYLDDNNDIIRTLTPYTVETTKSDLVSQTIENSIKTNASTADFISALGDD